MTPTHPFHWKDRFKAGSIHLGISLMIATLAALLVFGLWYPYPYRETSGGRESVPDGRDGGRHSRVR